MVSKNPTSERFVIANALGLTCVANQFTGSQYGGHNFED